MKRKEGEREAHAVLLSSTAFTSPVLCSLIPCGSTVVDLTLPVGLKVDHSSASDTESYSRINFKATRGWSVGPCFRTVIVPVSLGIIFVLLHKIYFIFLIVCEFEGVQVHTHPGVNEEFQFPPYR